MKELEHTVTEFLSILGTQSNTRKKKLKRQTSEMELMIDLKSNEFLIIDYMNGFSTEELSIKYNLSFKQTDKIIDCYNYLYN